MIWTGIQLIPIFFSVYVYNNIFSFKLHKVSWTWRVHFPTVPLKKALCLPPSLCLVLSHPEALIFSTPPLRWFRASRSLFFFSPALDHQRGLTNEIIPVAFPIGWDLHPIVTTPLRAAFFRWSSRARPGSIWFSYWHNTEGATLLTLTALGRFIFFLLLSPRVAIVSQQFLRIVLRTRISNSRDSYN